MSRFRGIFGPIGPPSSGGAGARRARVHAIDAVRGLAIVVMILWHTADGWLVDAVRDSTAFATARLIGGLAAPGFLFLAGLSLALAAPDRIERPWVIASSRRAARIILVGYGLNLWAWAIDRGALLEPGNRPIAAAAALALALGAGALRDRETPHGARLGLVVGAVATTAVIGSQLGVATRAGASLLPRLDVLHGIGAALIVTALALWALRPIAERHRALALAAVAVAVSAASVAMIGVPQQVLPIAIADWIARTAPWPAPTTSGFPLFPWLGYALLGAAIGRWLRGTSPEHAWALPRVARPLVLAGVALVIAALTWDLTPTARAVLDHASWLRSTFRLAFNVSMIVAAGALVASLRAPRAPLREGLAMLGRSSMLVYCVHLEVAFGLAGVPLHRALGWPAWALGLTLLVLAMTALAWGAEHMEARARKRSSRTVHAAA